MDDLYLIVPFKVAAGTALISNLCPPDTTSKWRLTHLALMPNVTSATDGTNYATVSVYSDTGTGTSIATAKTTNSSGGAALTAGAFDPFVLTGTPTQLECFSTQPLHVDVAHAASGVAIDCTLLARFIRIS